MIQRRSLSLILCACAVMGSLHSAAKAAPILLVDFDDRSGAGNSVISPTQSGFSSFVQSTNNATTPLTYSFGTSIGTLDVTVGGYQTTSGTTGGFLDRAAPTNSGSFTYSNLYRDFLFTNTGGGTLTLAIKGVQPNTDYELTFWSSDVFADPTNVFADVITNRIAATGTTSGAAGTITFDTTQNATSNLQHSFTGLFRSTTDTLSFNLTDVTVTGLTADVVRLNGFQLSAVPEPSAVAIWILAGVAAAGWWVRRWKTF